MADKKINWVGLLKFIGLDFDEFDATMPEIKQLKEQIKKNFEKYGRNGEHINNSNVNNKGKDMSNE